MHARNDSLEDILNVKEEEKDYIYYIRHPPNSNNYKD